MEKKKKLFDLVLSVSENGERITTDFTCTKDGQNMMPEAMTGTNVSYALEALRYATGLFARLYVVQLHNDGKITDEHSTRSSARRQEADNLSISIVLTQFLQNHGRNIEIFKESDCNIEAHSEEGIRSVSAC